MSERAGLLLQQVGYTYPTGTAPAVQDVDLVVEPGEVVLITGPTGCGKSTLLRLAAGLLERHGRGRVAGRATCGGLSLARAAPRSRVEALGFVSQEPADQLVAATVADEVAFAPESAGWAPADIDARIGVVLRELDLDVEPERAVAALSGGQQQRLVVGAALAAGAATLLLDEPLAQLDPRAARRLMEGLRALADRGRAVVMVEHRLQSCLPWCDRVVLLAEGAVVWQGEPGELPLERLRKLGLTLPGLVDLRDRLGGRDPDTLAFRQASRPAVAPGEVLVSGRDVRFAWPGSGGGLLGIDVEIRSGERVALVGGNGAGKSTLLGALSGRLETGGVVHHAPALEVPQDPDLSLFCSTVARELAYGPREQGLGEAVGARVAAAAAALSVADLLQRPPQALSRGQRLRVAVAAGLACRPRLLLLDEPTSGQDRDQVERMLLALRHALTDGALVFATHDLDLALRHGTRVLLLEDGRVVADGEPSAVLGEVPEDGPLLLPTLARWCLDRGLPPATAAELADLVDGEAD